MLSNKQNLSDNLFKKDISKKIAFWIIGTLLTAILLFVLNIRVCAPCTYQFNDRDYSKACPEICASTPKWKILFFELTGKNLDYKERSNILPKPF